MTAEKPVVLQVLVSTRAGGGPQHVLALARWLRARGWRPIVAGPADGPLFERFTEAGIEAVEVPTHRLGLRAFARLRRLVRERSVRLVHSHGKGAGLYARLLARTQGLRAVHTFHGIHFERYGPLARAAYLALERRLGTWTDVVINVSRAQEAEGLALGLFTAGQSRVVRNGVDVARLTAAALHRSEARKELGVDRHGPLVGCAARFDEVKRLDLLLDAVAAAGDPSLRLALIGRGEEEPRLRAQAARLGLGERVAFPGELPDAARLFTAFDLYCAPSRKEGMPLGVLEAMALGVPVLASDIPAHREVLGEASSALVPLTAAAFAGALSALMADPAARAALGAEQRTRARSEFDVRETLAAIEAIYGEVMGL
jgi:glycosyltransferase involved in cell wall biosynthesis